MAIYNEILVGRFNRAIQKIMGTKGQPPVRQIASEIMPTISIFYGAEHRYLESWERFARGGSQGPIAAQNNAARLRNPAGSNMVVVVEKLLYGCQIADVPAVDLGAVTVDLTVAPGQRLDPRGRPNPTAVFSVGNNVVLATVIILSTQLAAGGSVDFISTDIQEITLLPGDAITVRSGAVNTQSSFGFIWRERFLEEPERS